jgi:hypothetical protein
MKSSLCKGALALILLQFSTFSYGQTTTQQLTSEQIASRVAYVYGNDFVLNYPALVTTYGKLMTDRIEYQFSVQDDTEKFPLLSSFSLITKNNPEVAPVNSETFSLETFNPLTYDFGFFRDKTLVVRIDGTNYLMIVKPQ